MSKISIKHTDNPSVIKFEFDQMLTENSFEYNSIDDAGNSNLVQQMFHLPFVKKVYITANFIAVEKFDILKWEEVENELKDILEAYILQHQSVFNESKTESVVEVYAESTPNPLVQKFVTNKLLTNYNIELTKTSELQEFPLAMELFEFPFVKEIFISDNYVSVQKTDDLDWIEINSTLRDFIKQYLQEGRRIVSENYKPGQNRTHISSADKAMTNDETSQQIISVLEEYIKPAVAGDGGNIQFLSYEPQSKEVNVLLQGACNGCPSSTITLKNGIEATLKQLLPGKISTVNALN